MSRTSPYHSSTVSSSGGHLCTQSQPKVRTDKARAYPRRQKRTLDVENLAAEGALVREDLHDVAVAAMPYVHIVDADELVALHTDWRVAAVVLHPLASQCLMHCMSVATDSIAL